MAHQADDVVFANANLARVITLNRPKKLNSLNTSMVAKITPRLLEYSKSSINNLVILTSSSPKGLCAGGDVAECAAQILDGNPGYASDFFQQEYNMNYLIGTYSKPYVSLMDGITMGGGVGLSVHAPFRVATERTKLAMPEMDIGFFPDVGTTFFLPRLDDKLGYYYALTGEVMTGLDAYLVGFATHYVPSERIPHLVTKLSNLQPPVLNDTQASDLTSQKEYFQQVNELIEDFADNKLPEGAKFPFSAEELTVISEGFSKPSVEEVLAYFASAASPIAKKIHDKLASKSPTSLRVGFELLNAGAQNSFKKQLELELIAATNIMNLPLETNDFVKGVKHKLIDKIKQPFFPEWTQPPTDPKKLLEKSISTTKLNQPLIEKFFGIDYHNYPYLFGLPNNQLVQSFVSGKETNKSYLPTPNEVKSFLSARYGNKLALELKLESILAAHADTSKYDGKYVSWK